MTLVPDDDVRIELTFDERGLCLEGLVRRHQHVVSHAFPVACDDGARSVGDVLQARRMCHLAFRVAGQVSHELRDHDLRRNDDEDTQALASCHKRSFLDSLAEPGRLRDVRAGRSTRTHEPAHRRLQRFALIVVERDRQRVRTKHFADANCESTANFVVGHCLSVWNCWCFPHCAGRVNIAEMQEFVNAKTGSKGPRLYW